MRAFLIGILALSAISAFGSTEVCYKFDRLVIERGLVKISGEQLKASVKLNSSMGRKLIKALGSQESESQICMEGGCSYQAQEVCEMITYKKIRLAY